MSTPLPALHTFNDDAWDDLLNYIEERRVTPIIGPDLLRVQTDRGLMSLYEWLADKLAARLQVDASSRHSRRRGPESSRTDRSDPCTG